MELDEDELSLLATSPNSTPWLALPTSTDTPSLRIKLYHCAQDSKLLLLAVDLSTGSVFFENLIEARSIHVRMRISSRDDESQRDSQSQIAEMKEGEAVSHLCSELAGLLSYTLADRDARCTSRGDEELEITLQLSSLPFKFRLDKASPRLTARVLGDLLLKPLLGVTNAMITAGVTKLEEHAHTIDEAAKAPAPIEGVLFSAMHRFSQATGGLAKSSRASIVQLSDRPKQMAKDSPKKAESPRKISKAEDAKTVDPDVTMPSPSPSPPATRSKAEEPDEDVASAFSSDGAAKGKTVEQEGDPDSDATEASDEESSSKATQTKRKRSPSPPPKQAKPHSEVKQEEPDRSTSAKAASRDPSPAVHSSPAVPTIRRPPTQARGAAKRGRRGSQWTNFG